MYSNYKEVRQAIKNKKVFKHGESCHAVQEGDIYRVVSYSTTMLEYDTKNNVVVFYNPAKYSQTTSRLQSIIRYEIGVN